jgi:hypothetical protein
MSIDRRRFVGSAAGMAATTGAAVDADGHCRSSAQETAA